MVDTAWCENQIDLQQNRCYHCGVFMNWMNRQARNGLTCERLDTALPHHKDNCVLCCFRCNNRKLSKDKALLLRYFRKWYCKTFDVEQTTDSERRPQLV